MPRIGYTVNYIMLEGIPSKFEDPSSLSVPRGSNSESVGSDFIMDNIQGIESQGATWLIYLGVRRTRKKNMVSSGIELVLFWSPGSKCDGAVKCMDQQCPPSAHSAAFIYLSQFFIQAVLTFLLDFHLLHMILRMFKFSTVNTNFSYLQYQSIQKDVTCPP